MSTSHGRLDAAIVEEKVIGLVQGYVEAIVDVTKPLILQGMDSLASMELRQKLQVSPHQFVLVPNCRWL